MSDESLGPRESMQILWRRKIILGIAVPLGILAGVAVGLLTPPQFSSRTLVMLPPVVSGLPGGPTHNIATQMIIAKSNPVLAGAGRVLDPPVAAAQLWDRVQVSSPSSQLIAISGAGRTAAQAEATANAVAHSYIAYLRSPGSPDARVAESATPAVGSPMVSRLVVTGVLGALVGVLVGAIVTLAVGRGDRRLRERDEIADAIGVPVLASVPVSRPDSAVGWAQLLADYEPGAAEAWSLRKALHHLGLTDVRDGGSVSLAVVSLSSDRGALALGPQLSAYAASLGIATALVMGPQQDENATAALCAACAGPAPGQPLRSGRLRVGVSDGVNAGQQPGAPLTVTPAVVDAAAPRVTDTMRAAVTVLGVSAGAATAEQLAQVVASAAGDGRQIAGILVANPDPADHTTGRVPQLMPRGQPRRPTRATAGSR